MNPSETGGVEPATVMVVLVTLVLLGAALFWLSRRGRGFRGNTVRVVELEDRLQDAEDRAARAEDTVRAGLLPHLARLLRARFVVRLMEQRSSLMEGQQVGTEKVAELEKRLADAHSDLQQKLANYERRMEALQADAPADAPRSEATPPKAATPSPGQTGRRNPLRPASTQPPPEPLRFHDVLAKRNQPPQPPPAACAPTASAAPDTLPAAGTASGGEAPAVDPAPEAGSQKPA